MGIFTILPWWGGAGVLGGTVVVLGGTVAVTTVGGLFSRKKSPWSSVVECKWGRAWGPTISTAYFKTAYDGLKQPKTA